MLSLYGELAVRIALNLQPGQRLLIIGPLANGGASLEAAPLVRHIAASAYRAGAQLVETLWGDEALQLARFDTRAARFVRRVLRVAAEGADRARRGRARGPVDLRQRSRSAEGRAARAGRRGAAGASRARSVRSASISRATSTNWAVVAAARAAWAARVFPDLPPAQQVDALWDAIARLCRLDRPDPMAAWEDAPRRARRAPRLSERQALHRAAVPRSRHRSDDRACRRATVGERPLDEPAGHPVRAEPADRGSVHDAAQGSRRRHRALDQAAQLRRHADRGLQPDVRGRPRRRRRRRSAARRCCGSWSRPIRGAARLGEVALVPHSSPVSQSGLLFYNTLFDENAASHVALGSAYKFTLRGGEDDERRGVRAGRRQPQRDARRFHDRLGRARRRRRAAGRHGRAADAQRRLGGRRRVNVRAHT